MKSMLVKRLDTETIVLIISETVSEDNKDWDLLDEEGIEVWVSDGWEQGIVDLRDVPVLQDVDLIIVDSRLSGIEPNYDWVREQIRERAIPFGQFNLFLMETFTDQLDLFTSRGMTQNSTWGNLPQRIPNLLLNYCGFY